MINPSANVSFFVDFNVYHKNWLIYSGDTVRPGELCYNFSISNDFTHMVNFPTRIPDGDSRGPSLLDLFISSDASNCSTMPFPPFGNSDHVVSISIDFQSNSKRDAPFHRIAYDCCRADWDGLPDYLRDVLCGDTFKLSASAASEVYEWFQVGIDIYILHRKYQVKLHSSPCFSDAFAAGTFHRNHFFVFINRINLLNLKVKFRQVSNFFKKV